MKDFFNDPELQTALRAAAASSRQSLAEIGSIHEVSSGDCFFFSESDDLPVRWVAALQHKDDPSMWFLVAADEFSQVGTCDIEVPDSSPMAPLVLRCNIGFWAHQDDVDLDRYVGRLDADSVADAKSRLSEMVHGQVPATLHGTIAEANDEYREWMAELSVVCEQIESRLQAEPVVLLKPIFDTSYTSLAIVAEHHAEHSLNLAADASGPTASESDAPPSLVLKSDLPGQLLLQRDGDEFDLVYYPASSEDQPPRLVSAAGLKVKNGYWDVGADRVCTWSQSLSSVEGHVSFVIGSSAFDINVGEKS
jgi:hypothetical protein